MSEKVELKEKLQAVDQNIRELWDAMDEENQKSLKKEFFILNRYISNVKNQPKAIQEHYVLTVNEYCNKHWNTLQDYPKLMWILLCMCSYNGENIYFHKWIGITKGSVNKKVRFLEETYPTMKRVDIELLAKINTEEDIKQLARNLGLEESIIAKKFK
jgi:predicted transcriptional regulator